MEKSLYSLDDMHKITFSINRGEDYNFRKLQTNENIIYTLYKETKDT